MKFVTFECGGDQRIGALSPDGDSILDLDKAQDYLSGRHVSGKHVSVKRLSDKQDPTFSSMLALIEAGPSGLDRAFEMLESAPVEAILDRSSVTLLAPLPVPAQIRCFSAFEEHAKQSAQAMMRVMASNSEDPLQALAEFQASGKFDIPPVFYERPLYYKGNRFSVVGTDTDVIWPAYSEVIDYELEIAAIIGRPGKHIRREEADSYLFGYSVFNDLSARDEQSREMVAPLGPAKGKDFDGGNVLGPCIVTVDELSGIDGLKMTATINDEVWTDTTSDGMAHSFADMLAYVSRDETIYPGEIFLSGCVGGGSGMEQQRYLSRGDSVALEIEGIGTIRNRIV